MSKKLILSIIIVVSNITLFAQDKLTLEKAIYIGLENNYGIAISKEQSKITDLDNRWGAVGAYPTITGSANFDFSSNVSNNPIISNSNTNALIGADWVLFNGFRVKASKRIAESKYSLSLNNEIIEIENCISDIVLSFYAYIVEKELLEVMKTLYTLSKDRYERDKVLSEIGGKGTYELIQSESAYLTDYQNMLMQERVVKSSIRNINLAMSVEPGKYWSINSKIEVPKSNYQLGTLLDLMNSNNSTIKHQYINQKVIEEGINMAKGDILPKLSVSAGGRYNLTSLSGANGSNGSFSPYAGVSLSATIFAGGIKQRNLTIAKIQSNIGEISIEEIKREMTTILMNQLDNYDYTRKILSLSDRDLEVAKINLNLSLEKFNSGSIDSFEYRIVHVEYLNAAINHQKLIFSLLSSNIELSRLIGGIAQEYKK